MFTVLNTHFTFRIFEQLCAYPEKQSCPENFQCIEYTFYIQDFWASCACPEKQSLPWNFSLHWIYLRASCHCPEKQSCPEVTVLNIYFLSFRIFEQVALALKNRTALKLFTVLKYFLSFRIFEQVAFALKIFTALTIHFTFKIFEQIALAPGSRFSLNHCIEYILFIIQNFWASCAYPEIFHCIEYTFHIQDFRATSRLPWKTELPWKFSLHWIYFLHSGYLSKLRLPWKTEFALKIFTALNIPSSKLRFPWIHCIEYNFLSFRIFEQVALALKNLKPGGAAALPASYAYERGCEIILRSVVVLQRILLVCDVEKSVVDNISWQIIADWDTRICWRWYEVMLLYNIRVLSKTVTRDTENVTNFHK